ncbi:MAG: hypothetical protein IPM04_13670 [Saprospiraceae bacterium]|nr:hypothetical protein [Candidatus Brachybacter algidus]MBK8748864.1 hypothetical protein [Candidatus Brachybacter algidus]
MKHASAKTAIVQLSKVGNEISVTVEDDGIGFNPVILQGTKGLDGVIYKAGWSI